MSNYYYKLCCLSDFHCLRTANEKPSQIIVVGIWTGIIIVSCSKHDPPPVPEAKFTFAITSNGVVNFTNTSTNSTSSTWNFGDGTSSSELSPKHTYSTNGDFTVQLTVVGAGGTATTTQTVTVGNVAPTIAFTFAFEANGVVNFTNLCTNATSYQWDFGDGSTTKNLSPSRTYSLNGAYSVQLTATGPGGTASLTQLVTVGNIKPVATFTFTITDNGAVNFTNASTNATSYIWTFGDGTTSTELSPSHTYSTFGTFTVQLTIVGSGGTASSTQSVVIIASGTYATIAAGNGHSMAVKIDGTLWAWGPNATGQIGDGTVIERHVPVLVGSGYFAIATGSSHSLALKTDGTLWAWGNNFYGQLGDGTTVERHAPVQIGSGYKAIAGGKVHSVAVKTDGTLWAWGFNGQGQLGDGTLVNKSSPVQIGAGYKAVASDGAIVGSISHSLALKTDGTLWAWGSNSNGQLGDGSLVDKNIPVQIGVGYAAIDAGRYHSLAVKTDGTLWSWGLNSSGQLGDGTLVDKSTPVLVGSGYVSVSGGSHSLALKPDGTLWAWGANNFSQLGDGTTVNRVIPVQIGSGYKSITAGGVHSLALKTNGTLWGWGVNNFGQLGDGTTTDKITPVLIGN